MVKKLKLVFKKKEKIFLIESFLIVLFNFLIFFGYSLNLPKTMIILSLDALMFFLILFMYKEPSFMKEKKKELLLLLFVLILFFFLFEVFLRATYCNYEYEFSPGEIQYKFYPDSTICNKYLDEYIIHAKVNNEGFIDDNFSDDPKRDNIFLLGDSFAACINTDYENCVHRRLEKIFKEEYGEQINVLNFGVPGYGALDELEILKKYGPIYNPSVVIVYFLPHNDLKENKRHLDYEYNPNYKNKQLIRKLSPKSISFFVKGTEKLILKILRGSEKYKLKSSYANQNIKNYEVYLKDYNEEWENLLEIQLNALNELKKVSEEINSTLVVVITNGPEQVYLEDWERLLDTYPSLKGKEYDLEKPNKIITSFLEEKNIYNLDLLPFFRSRGSTEKLHWEYEGHWNNDGQIFASELIRDYIIENGFIKK